MTVTKNWESLDRLRSCFMQNGWCKSTGDAELIRLLLKKKSNNYYHREMMGPSLDYHP